MYFRNVDEYIAGLEPWAAEIVTELRSLVKEGMPDSTETVKWAQPVYEFNGPFIFIKAHKQHVNFGFWRGIQMDDPKGLLEGTGGKMRHVKVTIMDDIDREAFLGLVRNAAELNIEHGDASRKKGL